jgi:hypothetical protein
MKRWPLYAAIAYVALLLISLAVVPALPEVSDSGTKVVRFFQDHANGVRVFVWLAAWSTVPLVLLFAALRARLRGTARDVMLLGAASVVITSILWTWFSAGLALHPSTLDASTARTISDIAAYYGPILTVSIVLVIAPVGLAAWRNDGFPKWLAWVTLVFVLEQSIETITIFGKSGFTEPGGPMNFTLGAGLYIVWLICAGAAVSTS